MIWSISPRHLIQKVPSTTDRFVWIFICALVPAYGILYFLKKLLTKLAKLAFISHENLIAGPGPPYSQGEGGSSAIPLSTLAFL